MIPANNNDNKMDERSDCKTNSGDLSSSCDSPASASKETIFERPLTECTSQQKDQLQAGNNRRQVSRQQSQAAHHEQQAPTQIMESSVSECEISRRVERAAEWETKRLAVRPTSLLTGKRADLGASNMVQTGASRQQSGESAASSSKMFTPQQQQPVNCSSRQAHRDQVVGSSQQQHQSLNTTTSTNSTQTAISISTNLDNSQNPPNQATSSISARASAGDLSQPDPQNLYPLYAPTTFFYLSQTDRPRSWCLAIVSNNTWFERISMIAILINCITLGSYQPCYDTTCESNRCQWLKTFDHVIFLFFFMEMLIKMIAMGVSNAPQAYLADYWNRLDCFIVIAGGLEYVLDIGNVNLTAIRTVRVLRPLRAINRIPSMRILVTLLLDTLPMLGNVLLLCFLVFFIFGIIGVQLWSGLLRQRCFISLPANMTKPSYVPSYYRLPNSDKEYLCSTIKENGLHRCQDLPALRSTDLSTVCQNTLPFSWQPPKPTIVIGHIGNESWQRQTYEDRFIDGELVPFDLVPGDESSPFLVKQMSPLIAQSVFQPAYAPRQVDSLSSMRSKRDTQHEQATAQAFPQSYTRGSPLSSSPKVNGSLMMHDNSIHPPHQLARHILAENSHNKSRHSSYHHRHKLGERIRMARLANTRAYPSFSGAVNSVHRQKSFVNSGGFDSRDRDVIVETNANSDRFDSISQTELIKSDKSSRKYYLRKKANKGACINWNKYYTECRAGDTNPFQGTISFDNVGMAWTTIFLVISLEGWSDIMYLLQDSHSFWVWIYFVLLIVIGSFFMINLCLVVIATQFSATKKREMERMRQERMKFSSSSTLTATSESTNCYTVIVKSIARCLRHAKIAFINRLKRRKCARLQKQRLHERQQHIESHQVTGIHSEDPSLLKDGLSIAAAVKRQQQQQQKRRQHQRHSTNRSSNKQRSNDDEPIQTTVAQSTPTANRTEANQISASARRSSWKRSYKTPAQRRGDDGQITVEEEENDRHQNDQPPAQASGEHLISSSNKTLIKEDGGGNSGEQKQPSHHHLNRVASNRRSIKLGHAECGPSCQTTVAAARKSSRHRSRDITLSSKALHSSCRHYHECEIEDVDISFCPKFISNNNKLQQFKRNFNHNIKQLVDHRYFQRLILLAILINAISMGIEYHNQPEQLTEAVEISNIVFACLFLIEMILKLIAHGIYDYVIDGFNCFDGCIVILSILELFESSSGSGLSVLRTFRLLRILKLVRFMPALRRQLVIMLRTLDNVAVFFALLVLFIFIFSILGMNLFGCKFCETLPDGTERCDRKNFNSLLWSLVTVFQILTQEDWNVVLFNGMEKTSHWAALYFVLLMTFGNYVLFNLLVAILVEGFSQEDDFKVSSSTSSTMNNKPSKGVAQQQQLLTHRGYPGGGYDCGGGGLGGGGNVSPLPLSLVLEQTQSRGTSINRSITKNPSYIRSNTTLYQDYHTNVNKFDNCDVVAQLLPDRSIPADLQQQKQKQTNNPTSYDYELDKHKRLAMKDNDDLYNYSSPTSPSTSQQLNQPHHHLYVGDLSNPVVVSNSSEKYQSIANEAIVTIPSRGIESWSSDDNEGRGPSQPAPALQLEKENKNKSSTHNLRDHCREMCCMDKSRQAFVSHEDVTTTSSTNEKEEVEKRESVDNNFGLTNICAAATTTKQHYYRDELNGSGSFSDGDGDRNGSQTAFVGPGQASWPNWARGEFNNVISGGKRRGPQQQRQHTLDNTTAVAASTTTTTTTMSSLTGSPSPASYSPSAGGVDRLPLLTAKTPPPSPPTTTINAASPEQQQQQQTRVCNLANASLQSIQQQHRRHHHHQHQAQPLGILDNKQAVNGDLSQIVDCRDGANNSIIELVADVAVSGRRHQDNDTLRKLAISTSAPASNSTTTGGARSSTTLSNNNDGDKLVNLAFASAAAATSSSSAPASAFNSGQQPGERTHAFSFPGQFLERGEALSTLAMTAAATNWEEEEEEEKKVWKEKAKVKKEGKHESGAAASNNISMKGCTHPPYVDSSRIRENMKQRSSSRSSDKENYFIHGRCNSGVEESRSSNGTNRSEGVAKIVSQVTPTSDLNSPLSICKRQTAPASAAAGQPITYGGHVQADCLPLSEVSRCQQQQQQQQHQHQPRYWNYGQLVTSIMDQPCSVFDNSAAIEPSAQSLSFFGIRRPPKRLVYFYDINDDVDEEIEFLTKSLETKSYATSMMGQHDHYLDNIAKSQAAAARVKAASKLQAQYRINMYRAEQEHHIKALALDSLSAMSGHRAGSLGRLGSNESDHASNSPPKRFSQVSTSKTPKDSLSALSAADRSHNIELVLTPHWSSLPSHINRSSIAMMRFYQSSYTNNFYLGKRERALLSERGQFDKSCCRVDYDSYTKALNVFIPKNGMPIEAAVKLSSSTAAATTTTSTNTTGGANTHKQMSHTHQLMASEIRQQQLQTKPTTNSTTTDINLGVIYEPFKLFPSIASSRMEPHFNKNSGDTSGLKSPPSANVDRSGPNAGIAANYWQRELLASLESYANAIGRYEERQAMRKRAHESGMMNSASNLNRTTQALRRGSVIVLSKLKLLHAQNNGGESSSSGAAHRDNQLQQQHHLQQENNSHRSVLPRLSLTKADSLVNSSQDNVRSTVETIENISQHSVRLTSGAHDVSDVAIPMSSDSESLASPMGAGGDVLSAGSCRLRATDTHDAFADSRVASHMQMSHLHHPHGMPVYSRHSIANLPMRSLAETSTNSDDNPLARPASYTPNIVKRSSPRPSLIGGWFNHNKGSASDRTNRNSCFSQTSKATSELTEKCTKLLRPNLRRRRSFSGPYEWLQHEHKRPYDMMLSPVKKQTTKKRLRKMKPQKSNSSDYHSLNNRRVYKLDSRGFQTKLKGVFYVITHDPLLINAHPSTSAHPMVGGDSCRNMDIINSSYDFGQQQHHHHQQQQQDRENKDIVSSNEIESSFFNTSNEDNSVSGRSQSRDTTGAGGRSTASRNQHRRTFLVYFHWTQWMVHRRHYSLFLFSPQSRIRRFCLAVTSRKEFDYFVLFFISMNCVTLAMERPKIPPWSKEREFLTVANYYFTFMFTLEMALKVIAKGLYYGKDAYLSDSWNIMDGSLVGFSLFDLSLSIVADRSPRIFAILRVFRLLRSLRPLRVINRLMGLKLVVQTLLLSLRPIGNIVLICCTFFIIFGILGVQLFKGTFYYCDGPDPLEIMRSVRTREDCLVDHRNRWVNRKYNFDNLGQALMALFVLSSKDGWVNIMYTGLDAVGVDMQPRENYNEWRLLYFISFLLLVAFFVLNMFVGVVVENFHRCRKEQELEEKARRAEKRQRKLDKRRRKLREPPYYSNYGKVRLLLHKWVTGGYFDLLIAAVIGFNVIFMSLEHYQMPGELIHILKVSNYVFTAAFILEAAIKSAALGMRRYMKDRWNQLDVMIVAMSIIGIIFEEMDSFTLPINPTLLRVLRVMRIARVLKLLKMAKGIRALLDTVMQALPQVGNLGLLFFLLFFIFAALGVELFGRLECNDEYPCSGLMDQHAHFQNFGLAFLTLFRVATGDNWNGIMKDTLRDKCDPSSNCLKNCCVSQIIAPLYFVVFVLLAQFVLVNVVVAVLMKHLEESHHEMEIDEEYELDKQLAEELEAKKKALIEARDRQNLYWI